MPNPTVAAVMLTADRPEMARKAIDRFSEQTYPAKRLVIWDTGKTHCISPELQSRLISEICYVRLDRRFWAKSTIGELRNDAACHAPAKSADILIHFDDDDYSHPNRIAEQVALLQSSGADVVGYHEMLFWRESYSCGAFGGEHLTDAGEAWLYSNPTPSYALGTSLCYWRKTWERKPFEALPDKSKPFSASEDAVWREGLKCIGIAPEGEPRMIARIHSGNTSQVYRPDVMRAVEKQGGEWKRVPLFDSYCRGLME